MVSLPRIALDNWHSSDQSDSLNQTFNLEPTDICVRYFLHIDGAAQVAAIVINEHDIDVVVQDDVIVVDVTDYVALDENTIALGVTGALGSVWLQAVPCDDCLE